MIDWDTPCRVSRALVLQIGEQGEILARSSLSQRAQVLDGDLIPVLIAFATSRTPRQVLAQLKIESDRDGDGFIDAVTTLVKQKALLTVDRASEETSGSTSDGFSSAAIHHSMVRDTVRVLSYRQAIFKHCRDQTVVEIGCGSGILSVFAAQAGAKRVISIEESGIADLALEMFRTNGVADRIELRRANSRDVFLDERADVIVHELFGSDPFDEALVPSITDACARLLMPGGLMIPSALEVCCVGFEVADRPFFDIHRATTELTELGGLYGLDLGVLERALETEAIRFQRPLGDLGQAQFAPQILTDELRLYSLDFCSEASLVPEPRDDLRLRANRAGSLGGVLLYFRAHLDEQTVLSTSPHAPRTHWRWDARPLKQLVSVQPGQEIPIKVELHTVRGVEGLHVALA